MNDLFNFSMLTNAAKNGSMKLDARHLEIRGEQASAKEPATVDGLDGMAIAGRRRRSALALSWYH